MIIGVGRSRKSIVLIALLVSAVLVLFSCSKEDEKIAGRLLELESGGQGSGGTSDRRIAELEKDVARYRKIVEEKVEATEKLGSYYKLLALAYLDRAMYGPALDALEKAVAIHPEQAPLFLFRAIAAGRLSKAVGDEAQRRSLLAAAEESYLRAASLDPLSNQAPYGLAVLYFFELDRPEDALPLVEGVLARENKNVDALFLLAGIHYALGNPEDALDAYDRIIGLSEAGTRRDEARRNRNTILEGAVR